MVQVYYTFNVGVNMRMNVEDVGKIIPTYAVYSNRVI